ncbi:MAG: hypothetical protein ABR548_00335 [Actinomycetota bacterium]|nr:hypothetical protein [Actinomycetota bacterium]
MNWILAEDRAREHMDALRRAAADDRRVRLATQDRIHPVRRAVGVRLVRAGLRVAAGVRAARSAHDIVGAAICGDVPLAGGTR